MVISYSVGCYQFRIHRFHIEKLWVAQTHEKAVSVIYLCQLFITNCSWNFIESTTSYMWFCQGVSQGRMRPTSVFWAKMSSKYLLCKGNVENEKIPGWKIDTWNVLVSLWKGNRLKQSSWLEWKATFFQRSSKISNSQFFTYCYYMYSSKIGMFEKLHFHFLPFTASLLLYLIKYFFFSR